MDLKLTDKIACGNCYVTIVDSDDIIHHFTNETHSTTDLLLLEDEHIVSVCSTQSHDVDVILTNLGRLFYLYQGKAPTLVETSDNFKYISNCSGCNSANFYMINQNGKIRTLTHYNPGIIKTCWGDDRSDIYSGIVRFFSYSPQKYSVVASPANSNEMIIIQKRFDMNIIALPHDESLRDIRVGYHNKIGLNVIIIMILMKSGNVFTSSAIDLLWKRVFLTEPILEITDFEDECLMLTASRKVIQYDPYTDVTKEIPIYDDIIEISHKYKYNFALNSRGGLYFWSEYNVPKTLIHNYDIEKCKPVLYSTINLFPNNTKSARSNQS